MKFLTGSRWRSGGLVIRPTRSVFDPSTGQWAVVPGLRVHVRDHRIDTEAMQTEYGWSDADREFVEDYLLNHKDFGRSDGRGLFLNTENTIVKSKTRAQQEAEAIELSRTLKRICIWKEDMGDDIIGCSNPVQEGEDSAGEEFNYCETHQHLVDQARAIGA